MPRFNFTNITLETPADITDVMDNFNILETNGVSQNDLNAKVDYLEHYIATVLQDRIMADNPVGSILFNVTGDNPSNYMGFGTWTLWGSGRVPVGVNFADTNFNTAEKTGGSKTHTLTIAEMPKHTHTFTGVAHVHSYSKSSTATGKASGNTGSTTLTVNQIPSHNHKEKAIANPGSGGSGIRGTFNGTEASGMVGYDTGVVTYNTGGGQGHTHSLNEHTHTISLSSANTSSVAAGGSNSETGSGTAHSILQPYITCYMWKRTA